MKYSKLLVDPSDIVINEKGQAIPLKGYFELKPELESTYEQYRPNEKNSYCGTCIYQVRAYAKNGFYAYFDGICDQRCLTTNIVSKEKFILVRFQTGAIKIFQLLGYETISDIDTQRNCRNLKKIQ